MKSTSLPDFPEICSNSSSLHARQKHHSELLMASCIYKWMVWQWARHLECFSRMPICVMWRNKFSETSQKYHTYINVMSTTYLPWSIVNMS